MTKQETDSLEEIVDAARCQYAAAQYPGDLAADLGLSAHVPRGWLQRWRPAVALCAVLALAVGGAGLWALLGPSPHGQAGPVVEATPENRVPNVSPPSIPQHGDESGDTLSPTVNAAITREQFVALKQDIADLRASAKRTADIRFTQLLASNQKVKPAISVRPLTPAAVGLSTVPHVGLSLPRGLALPAYSPSSIKELS
ncbi:MAG: hypothetical protein AAGA29_03865 [Planctomycetota bacterium]